MRSDAYGSHLRTVNLLSCSKHQTEMIRIVLYGASPDDGYTEDIDVHGNNTQVGHGV